MPDKSSIISEQKCFTILLGNGKKLSYTTIKDFYYALSEVNRQLNVMLFELNETWIFAFAEYRRLWFYMMNTRTSHERSILELNQDIHRAFHLITERSNWANGNVFSFKYLFTIIESLSLELDIMAQIRRGKKQFIEYHLLQTKKRSLERISEALKEMNVQAKYARSVNP